MDIQTENKERKIQLHKVTSFTSWIKLLKDNKKEINRTNMDLIALISAVFAIVAVCTIVAAFLISDTHLVPVWAGLLIFSGSLMVLSSRFREAHYALAFIIIFLVLLYGGALYISYFARPQANFISVIVLLVLMPSMFIVSPGKIMAFSAAAMAACVSLNTIMPHPLLPVTELNTNYVLCGIGGAIFGIYTGYIKLTALDNARLMKIISHMDTGISLLNRNSFFDDYAEKYRLAQLDGLFMIDVNDFKKINDTYGHMTGDECLSAIAKVLNAVSAQYPVTFYRYGGDEFIGALHHETDEQYKDDHSLTALTDTLTEFIRNSLTGVQVTTAEGKVVSVSVSIGYSRFEPGETDPLEHCIRRADQAMYIQKNFFHGSEKDM